MTRTYIQIQKQIERLQSEALNIRRNEMRGVIERIKNAIRAYDLTAEDLGLAARRSGRPPKGLSSTASPSKAGRKMRKSKLSSAPKYRDEAGNTWVGRGKRPDWLREALANGRALEEFLIR